MRLCPGMLPGMLMVPIRGCGMCEQATGGHERQRHIDPGNAECDAC